MEATIEGLRWRATIGIQVVRSGVFLAVSGIDESGTLLTFAVPTDSGTGTQQLGATSANAVLMLAGEMWTASSARGSGSICLSVLTRNRAAGTFVITAARPRGRYAPATCRIIDGCFDVDF
jgi:hypothetical protein